MAEPTALVVVTEKANMSLLLDHHNISGGNVTPADDGLGSGQIFQGKTVVSSIAMFSAGVLSNVVALILMATAQPEQKQTMFYKLMAGLVCTDLIGTCATSPVVIMVYITGKEMQEGTVICNLFGFTMVLAGFSTMSVICAMSIERHICMCHPYIYQCKMPKKYPRFALAFAWLSSTFIALLPLIGIGHNVVQIPKTWCFFDVRGRQASDVIFSCIYIIIGFLNLTVTFYCNITTIITVFTRRRRQRQLSAFQGQTVRYNRSMTQRIAELHMIAMNFGVTIVFTACYGPLMMCALLFQTDLVDELNTHYVLLLMVRMASFNQIFDPLVYIVVRRDLRWKIISFFKRILRICHSPGDDQEKRTSLSGLDTSLMYASSQSVNRISDGEADVSFKSFCYHCLCDPPSYSTLKSNNCRGRLNQPTIKVSTQALVNNPLEKCVIRQPSREEEMELNVIINQNGRT